MAVVIGDVEVSAERFLKIHGPRGLLKATDGPKARLKGKEGKRKDKGPKERV